MGLVKRRLYKPERKAARVKGVLNKNAPIACPNASGQEIGRAVFSLCEASGVVAGRCSGYDPLRDEYTVVGKSLATGIAQDFKVRGLEVAELIVWMRRVDRQINRGVVG